MTWHQANDMVAITDAARRVLLAIEADLSTLLCRPDPETVAYVAGIIRLAVSIADDRLCTVVRRSVHLHHVVPTAQPAETQAATLLDHTNDLLIPSLQDADLAALEADILSESDSWGVHDITGAAMSESDEVDEESVGIGGFTC
jgi:hypothetical protein